MLFTTAVFVCLFLPVVLAGFFLVARVSRAAAAGWLFAASLVFYGYWQIEFTLLLLASICGNFWLGSRIVRSPRALAPRWLGLGVAANLALLAYFKYANFFIDSLNAAFGTPWTLGHVVLPIGISFFTFTQIAFLADACQKGVREYSFVHYGLFVTYFPHLIAGPVLHHAQMMPQFADARSYRWQGAHVAGGLAIFALGLFKKVVLADGIAPYADAVFTPADAGQSPDAQEAWLGALAYTLQLYFDFSGYSDMAVGLSWMFNIRLPFNFDSPYRATSISEFWRRWHISLSNFLRDYLYIALGGNRHGPARRYLYLMTTMLLGGLWHGAGWTFVFWGGLHGVYLVANHGFRALCGEARLAALARQRLFAAGSWALTMAAVVLAWVFFRAASFAGAWRMLQGMAGATPTGPVHPLLWNAGLQCASGALWCGVLGVLACAAPNSNRIGTVLLARCQGRRPLQAGVAGAALAAVGLLVLVNTLRDSVSAFIYFNF
ncbi:MAG TPA: MBOAT family O-acyltransferase [Ideonella sp.]|nr:MBOAT family O-acyltransferase [Ideonella sp.]